MCVTQKFSLKLCLHQCFPTFFGPRHPYLAFKIFGGTLSLFNRYNGQGIVTTGGTPGNSSRHPCAPRHPGKSWHLNTHMIKHTVLVVHDTNKLIRCYFKSVVLNLSAAEPFDAEKRSRYTAIFWT